MRPRISHDALSTVLGAVHVGLMTNLLLVATTVPFTALLIGTDLLRSWPLLLVAAPTSFPALVAVCAVFDDRGGDGVTRTFLRAWRAGLGPGLLLGVLSTTALTLIGLDVRFLFGRAVGAVLIPVLVMFGLLIAATVIHAVVAFAQAPRARLRTVLAWSVHLAVRRWYLSAMSLIVLGLLAVFVLSHPALGLGVAAAPLLYPVWANSRFALRPAVEQPPAGARVIA